MFLIEWYAGKLNRRQCGRFLLFWIVLRNWRQDEAQCQHSPFLLMQLDDFSWFVHSVTITQSRGCYLPPFLDKFVFESPLDSDQQDDDALVSHGVCCSSQCHVPCKFQTREPSLQEPQPASPGSGHSCGQTLTVYCSVHLPATSSNVKTCTKSATI